MVEEMPILNYILPSYVKSSMITTGSILYSIKGNKKLMLYAWTYSVFHGKGLDSSSVVCLYDYDQSNVYKRLNPTPTTSYKDYQLPLIPSLYILHKTLTTV